MTAEAQTRIESMLSELLSQLAELRAPLEAPMTQTAFARRVGKHPKTISNWIKARKITTRNGLIPASEVRKFLT